MKKLWRKIKTFTSNLQKRFIAWFMSTALPWLKNKWMRIVDLMILFMAYNAFDNAGMSGWATLVAIWIFVLLVYNVFWQFFGAGKAVKALIAQKKKK